MNEEQANALAEDILKPFEHLCDSPEHYRQAVNFAVLRLLQSNRPDGTRYAHLMEAGGRQFMHSLTQCQYRHNLLDFLNDAEQIFNAVASTPDSIGYKAFQNAKNIADALQEVSSLLVVVKATAGAINQLKRLEEL